MIILFITLSCDQLDTQLCDIFIIITFTIIYHICSNGLENSTVIRRVSTCIVKRPVQSLEMVIDEDNQLTMKMIITDPEQIPSYTVATLYEQLIYPFGPIIYLLLKVCIHLMLSCYIIIIYNSHLVPENQKLATSLKICMYTVQLQPYNALGTLQLVGSIHSQLSTYVAMTYNWLFFTDTFTYNMIIIAHQVSSY